MVLGLASGMTAGEVLHYPVKHLDVLEINDQVVEACKIFAPWNNKCLSDPRVDIIVQDGRNHLALTRSTYDVIISEPSNPWMAGLANLFTLEFFQTVKDRLREDGIFVQWIHSYEMDWPTFAMVGRTFTEVFPNSLLMTPEQPDYLLVGFSGQQGFDLEVAKKNIKYAHRSKNIYLPNPRLPYRMIITEDLKRLFGPGLLHTDNWPRLEFAAPKKLYTRDVDIQERMSERWWLSSQTKEIVEASSPMDALLDMLEFSASAYDPLFRTVDLDHATPSQRDKYLGILKAYCNEALVTDYDMLPDSTMKAACAELQAARIREHLAQNPEDAQAYCHLGQALVEMGRIEEAVGYYFRALRIKPQLAAAHHYLGVALGRQGRLEEAISHLNEALRIKPNVAEAQTNLGVALAQQGRFEEASRHFYKALQIKPDYAQAKTRLTTVLQLMGKDQQVANTTAPP
jgi:spermidine synthase